MVDVTPSLLEKITEHFNNSLKTDKKYLRIVKQIENKKLSWDLANDYSIRLGELLSNSLTTYITPESLPNGRFYYNIANEILTTTLTRNQSMIADVAELVQAYQNERAGIGIKALRATVDNDRIKGFIDKVSNAEEFASVEWVLKEPVVNYSQSVIDDAIKTNARFQAKAGLRISVEREAEAGACKWCRALAGTYNVNESFEIPHEVFQRHENCRCKVTYNAVKLKPYYKTTFKAD